jgi:hypothetical protein
MRGSFARLALERCSQILNLAKSSLLLRPGVEFTSPKAGARPHPNPLSGTEQSTFAEDRSNIRRITMGIFEMMLKGG